MDESIEFWTILERLLRSNLLIKTTIDHLFGPLWSHDLYCTHFLDRTALKLFHLHNVYNKLTPLLFFGEFRKYKSLGPLGFTREKGRISILFVRTAKFLERFAVGNDRKRYLFVDSSTIKLLLFCVFFFDVSMSSNI